MVAPLQPAEAGRPPVRRGSVQVDDHVVLRYHQLQRADHVPDRSKHHHITAKCYSKAMNMDDTGNHTNQELTERGSPLFHGSPHYRCPEGSKQQTQ